MVELINQVNGEFEEKFKTKNLTLEKNIKEQQISKMLDGRAMYRILENLYTNAYKYAQENTRVYVDLVVEGEKIIFILKNISEQKLNITEQELLERFVRGDAS